MAETATATVIPINPAAQAKRAVQWLVTCTESPEGDLIVEGTLTVDYEVGSPHTATFDPDDEDIPNAVIPVMSVSTDEDGSLMSIVSDEDAPKLWVFAIESDPRDADRS